MSTPIAWNEIDFPDAITEALTQTWICPGLPSPHPLEADVFDRQRAIPGHDQSALDCRVLLVGAGGLNSWIAVGLARSGVTSLTVLDGDRVDRTNLPRQLFFADDLGQQKGPRLAHNLTAHSTAGARITGIGMRFEEAVEAYPLPADLVVTGVDNNPARLAVSRFARQRGIPAVFAALSRDGMRVNALLQGTRPEHACWHCAQPNLDPEQVAPCAAAVISTCLLAAAYAVYFCHRALMGWPAGVSSFNWREGDLQGVAPEVVGSVPRRPGCPTCGGAA